MSSLQETVQYRSAAPNPCSSCGSDNETEFGTEINIHFPHRIDQDSPGMFVFPRLAVCLNCGLAHFILQKEELHPLRQRVAVRKKKDGPSSR